MKLIKNVTKILLLTTLSCLAVISLPAMNHTAAVDTPKPVMKTITVRINYPAQGNTRRAFARTFNPATTTLDQVKIAIKEHLPNLLVSRQVLSVKDPKDTAKIPQQMTLIDDDNPTLDDYDIQDGQTIFVDYADRLFFDTYLAKDYIRVIVLYNMMTIPLMLHKDTTSVDHLSGP